MTKLGLKCSFPGENTESEEKEAFKAGQLASHLLLLSVSDRVHLFPCVIRSSP